jgi:hypothetical protein
VSLGLRQRAEGYHQRDGRCPAPNAIDYNRDLGIFAMCAAARQRGGGPLTPVPVRVKRVPNRWTKYPPWEGWDWVPPRTARLERAPLGGLTLLRLHLSVGL